MWPGDADIDNQIGRDAHPVDRLAGFFRDGEIGRPRGDNRDFADFGLLNEVFPANSDGAGNVVVTHPG